MICSPTPSSLEDILRVPPPSPPRQVKYRWKGISHSLLIELMNSVAEERGMKLINPIYHLGLRNYKGQINQDHMTIGWTVEDPYEPYPDPSIQWGMGIHNATNGRFSINVYTGVYTEGIGVVMSEHFVARNSGRVKENIHEQIRGVFIDLIPDKCDFPLRIKEARKRKVTKETPLLLFEASRRQWISASRVVWVERELDKYNKPTYWDLLVSFARINQCSPPYNQLWQCFHFCKLLEI